MKKGIILFSIVAISIALLANAVSAQTRVVQTYDITANSNWTTELLPFSNWKDNYTNYSVVNWYSSSQKGSHNMWYRVVNSNKEDRGNVLISYLSRVKFQSNTSHGYYYALQARRENAVDPTTRVTGTWNP